MIGNQSVIKRPCSNVTSSITILLKKNILSMYFGTIRLGLNTIILEKIRNHKHLISMGGFLYGNQYTNIVDNFW